MVREERPRNHKTAHEEDQCDYVFDFHGRTLRSGDRSSPVWMFCLTNTIHLPSGKFALRATQSIAGLFCLQIRCVLHQRIVRCTSQRSKSEIPIEDVDSAESV